MIEVLINPTNFLKVYTSLSFPEIFSGPASNESAPVLIIERIIVAVSSELFTA